MQPCTNIYVYSCKKLDTVKKTKHFEIFSMHHCPSVCILVLSWSLRMHTKRTLGRTLFLSPTQRECHPAMQSLLKVGFHPSLCWCDSGPERLRLTLAFRIYRHPALTCICNHFSYLQSRLQDYLFPLTYCDVNCFQYYLLAYLNKIQYYLTKYLFPPSAKIMNSNIFFAWAMEIWASVSIKSTIQKETMHWRTEALCGMTMKAMRPRLKTIKLACRQQTVSLHIWWMPAEHTWFSQNVSEREAVCVLQPRHLSQYFSCYCDTLVPGYNMLFSEPCTDCFPFVLKFFQPYLQKFLVYKVSYISLTTFGPSSRRQIYCLPYSYILYVFVHLSNMSF